MRNTNYFDFFLFIMRNKIITKNYGWILPYIEKLLWYFWHCINKLLCGKIDLPPFLSIFLIYFVDEWRSYKYGFINFCVLRLFIRYNYNEDIIGSFNNIMIIYQTINRKFVCGWELIKLNELPHFNLAFLDGVVFIVIIIVLIAV